MFPDTCYSKKICIGIVFMDFLSRCVIYINFDCINLYRFYKIKCLKQCGQ